MYSFRLQVFLLPCKWSRWPEWPNYFTFIKGMVTFHVLGAKIDREGSFLKTVYLKPNCQKIYTFIVNTHVNERKLS